MYSLIVKVSIILANLNRVDFLQKCLQSFQDIGDSIFDTELIVVDGNSTDGSYSLLEKYADKIISEKDASVYEAWNKGLKLASGDWIFFLNSDDYLIPVNFKKLLLEISRNDFEIINFPVQISISNHKVRSTFTLRLPVYSFRSIISEPCYFNGYIFHKSVFTRVGEFNEQFIHCADQDFLWRCIENGIKCKTIMIPSYRYVSHSGSLTLNSKVLFFSEEMLIAQQFPIGQSNSQSNKYSKTWQIWEEISLMHTSKILRVLHRLFYNATFIQQIYSFYQKLQQRITSSKIFLSKTLRGVS